MSWCVYILRCSDDTLYTGITNDIARRVEQHNAGKGAKYTSCRVPVRIVYQEECNDRSEASKREIAIKRLSRVQKKALIDGCE